MSDKNEPFIVYAYMLSHKDRSKFTPELIKEHIAYLKKLESNNQYVMGGPFLNYKGGMIVVKAKSEDAAKKIAEEDPFISSGFENYEIRVWQLACEENNYLE